MHLKKHSHDWLPDGKLKVWVEVIADSKEENKQGMAMSFTVTVDANISKADLDKAIKDEYAGIQKRKERERELGIGENVEK